MAKGLKWKRGQLHLPPHGRRVREKPSKAKTPEPTPGVQTQYRDLNLEYFRLADETQAALRRLLQYEIEHPELFPLHRS